MAREAAGDDWGLFQEYMPEIHRLAELVRADERARMAERPAQQQEPVVWVRTNGLNNSGVAHYGPTCPPGWVGAATAYFKAPVAQSEPAQQEPVAYMVKAHGMMQRLSRRADVADELACMYRKDDPNAEVLPLYTSPPKRKPLELDEYDAGFLNDFGGGNVEWWWDYIRYELGRAHDFYQEQVEAAHNIKGEA